MKPHVSIITPLFNDPQGIARTLNGLAAQSFDRSHFEIIVADNGSKDDSKAIAQSFALEHPELQIRVISVEKPGSYAARNAAVKISRADNFAFIDSECLPVEGWLESGLATLSKSEGYVAGPIIFEFQRKQPTIAELLDAEKHLHQELHVRNGWSATANMFATRAAFDQAGGFLEDLFSGADRLFGAQMARVGIRAEFAPGAIVYHPARATWAAIRKKRRRVAAGMAQRDVDGSRELLNGAIFDGPIIPRIQQIPKPTILQLPGYLLLKALCKRDQEQVAKETRRAGKASLRFRT